jgi:hypothetical protein
MRKLVSLKSVREGLDPTDPFTIKPVLAPPSYYRPIFVTLPSPSARPSTRTPSPRTSTITPPLPSYELEEGEIVEAPLAPPLASQLGQYLPERNIRTRSRPVKFYQKSAHLMINPRTFSDLKRRVNNQLIKCCETTIQQLQKKIDGCKASSPQSCRNLYETHSLSEYEKRVAYEQNFHRFEECGNYRNTMERAFSLESDFSDPLQAQSYEGHRWQRLKLQREAEECKVYQTGERLHALTGLDGYLKKIYS